MEVSLFGALLALLILFAIYSALNAFVLKTWNYFSDRGVVFDRGVPLLGSYAAAMIGRESLADTTVKLYKRYRKHKFIGAYQMAGKPVYLVNDPGLIKAITVKDFDHFINHNPFMEEKVDKLLGRNLFNMTDDKWRDMRSILSPLFTGSKMRGMLSLMNECIEHFVDGVCEDVKRSGPAGKEYNLMDLYSCSTNDVIASCAFGYKIDSFRNRDNEFYTIGKEIVHTFEGLRFFIAMVLPKLAE